MATGTIQRNIDFIQHSTLQGNSSNTLILPNGFRGIIYIFRGSTVMAQMMVNVAGSGAVNVCVIATFDNLSYTIGTNTLTFTNNSSATSQIYYIGSDIVGGGNYKPFVLPSWNCHRCAA